MVFLLFAYRVLPLNGSILFCLLACFFSGAGCGAVGSTQSDSVLQPRLAAISAYWVKTLL